MKKILFILFIFLSGVIYSQETAWDYFNGVSKNYEDLESYTALFKFTTGSKGNIIQEGTIYYKSPNLLQLEYSAPKDQVLNVNATLFSVYVPSLGTVFEQEISTEEDAKALEVSGLTSQGLNLFKTNYSIRYLETPGLVPLDESNPEEVHKLFLSPRNTTELFSSIILSISVDGYIRRIESTKKDGDVIVMDIVDLKPNEAIADSRFDYSAPPTASTIRDFLFTLGEDE